MLRLLYPIGTATLVLLEYEGFVDDGNVLDALD